jgi:hypothetical protein
MRKPSAAALRVEELAGRLLPSAVMPPAHVMPPVHRDPLAGRGQGPFTAQFVPDAGALYQFRGTATLADLGAVTVTGSAHGVGLIASGHAGGALTFANARGSVTVELDGPTQPAFGALPHYFRYHVVAGTGAFGHLRDGGMLRLDLAADGGHFRLAI